MLGVVLSMVIAEGTYCESETVGNVIEGVLTGPSDDKAGKDKISDVSIGKEDVKEMEMSAPVDEVSEEGWDAGLVVEA